MNLRRHDGKANNNHIASGQDDHAIINDYFLHRRPAMCIRARTVFCSECIRTSGATWLHGQQLMIAMVMFVAIAGMLLPLMVACALGNVSWVFVFFWNGSMLVRLVDQV